MNLELTSTFQNRSVDVYKRQVKNSNLSVNPIYFINMGHSGSPGKNGDTKDMFDSRLKQNIAWSCYYQAKTITAVSYTHLYYKR